MVMAVAKWRRTSSKQHDNPERGFDQQDLIQAQRSGLRLMEDSLPCRGAPRGTLGKERSPRPLWPWKHPSEG
jgi:hypothetical protein